MYNSTYIIIISKAILADSIHRNVDRLYYKRTQSGYAKCQHCLLQSDELNNMHRVKLGERNEKRQ